MNFSISGQLLVTLLLIASVSAIAKQRYPPVRAYYNRNPFWIHPGTRWCGTGHRVSNYSDLGNSFESDSCCRDHDHCQVVIPPKTTRYGYTSRFYFTLSHCECDVKFYFCLTQSSDAQSSSVVSWFFHVLRMPCFELVGRPVCLQQANDGSCARSGTEEFAELRQLPFFSDDIERMRRGSRGV